MRVTLVTETYTPQVNGVSRTLSHLVEYLRARGDRVQVVHPNYHIKSHDMDAVVVPAVTMPFYPDVRLPRPPFGKVHRAIERFHPDIVHIATEVTLGLSTLLFSLRKNLPVVSSFHTNFDEYTSHYQVGWARGLIWRYMRWFHNATIETYVPSPSTIRGLEARGFERLVLWPRGVNSHWFRPDRPGREAIRESLGFTAADVVIGHVSRIAAEKNVEYLGAALEIVLRARPQSRVMIVGDGPARPALEESLGTHARFVGFRTGESLADHYAACDLFAFASLTETFGNVVLEAMASGLPVVAVAAGGVADIVESGCTGVLVETSDPPEVFAARLIELIDHPERLKSHARSAREHAESQTWDAIMGALRDRYIRVADARSLTFSP